jgi:hypothetical protein
MVPVLLKRDQTKTRISLEFVRGRQIPQPLLRVKVNDDTAALLQFFFHVGNFNRILLVWQSALRVTFLGIMPVRLPANDT